MERAISLAVVHVATAQLKRVTSLAETGTGGQSKLKLWHMLLQYI